MFIHAGGVVVFIAIASYAFYRAPPGFARINAYELAIGFALAGVATLLQAAQVLLFFRQERCTATFSWMVWFSAEKAWMNSVLPAKIGTAGALVVLQRKLGISWTRYMRFMLLCGVVTVLVSLAALIFMISMSRALLLATTGCFVVAMIALRWIYPVALDRLLLLSIIAVANLAVLSAAVGACVKGLGYSPSMADIAPVGISMNLLSVVAVTPGNFGIREAALSLLTPLMTLDFSVVIQGSTCYVVARLLACLLIATLLRGTVMSD